MYCSLSSAEISARDRAKRSRSWTFAVWWLMPTTWKSGSESMSQPYASPLRLTIRVSPENGGQYYYGLEPAAPGSGSDGLYSRSLEMSYGRDFALEPSSSGS